MNDDLKNKLSPLAWKVTQEQATEPPFSGEYDEFSQTGQYHCVCCDHFLFSSDTKFNSGCGWPAFFESIEDATKERIDHSHGMTRVEVVCGKCEAHLGHKFSDGPYGTRYCINSVALAFHAK
ncbi:peptide-methionine (R)-S-oxide reductase MsrB [Aliikangiella maris]|uniref:peptide-methionine (R)-S-oxide reductase n=2 Tax=Aliikangiella maris TaxID=3162458 RepID=A0ABV3MP84_9GAMM